MPLNKKSVMTGWPIYRP